MFKETSMLILSSLLVISISEGLSIILLTSPELKNLIHNMTVAGVVLMRHVFFLISIYFSLKIMEIIFPFEYENTPDLMFAYISVGITYIMFYYAYIKLTKINTYTYILFSGAPVQMDKKFLPSR